MAGRVRSILIAASALLAAGCAQTTRVDETLTPTQLATSNKAVAIMKLGIASPNCRNVSVLLGVRDAPGFYKRVRAVNVVDVRSPTDPPIAEVELDAGEYHIIGFACGNEKGYKIVSADANHELYRSSHAYFTLAPGEIVNVGWLHMNASRVGRSTFGRQLRTDVRVTDWPLAEIDRYKAKRPEMYAKLTTRLMTLTPKNVQPEGEECARYAQLKAEGKVQNLPASCLSGRVATR